MGTRRWLTKEGLARERRERVRLFMQQALGRAISDIELNRAFDDFETHMLLMQDRLGDVVLMEADTDDDDIPVHRRGETNERRLAG